MAEREPVLLEVEQLLAMRQFVGLESLSLDAAARMLATMTERSVPAGAMLAEAGSPLRAAWFLREGELVVGGPPDPSVVATRDPVGLLELLAGAPNGLDVRCKTDVVVLEIDGDELTALLADDFDALVGALRSIAGAILELSTMEPALPSAPAYDGPSPMPYVDRLLFLRGVGSFGAAGAETSAELALAMKESSLEGVVAKEGDYVRDMIVVVEGSLAYGDGEVSRSSVFGALHGLGEVPLSHDLVAAPGTRVLTLPVETLLDLAEDDVLLAVTWLRAFAARLLEVLPEDRGAGLLESRRAVEDRLSQK